MTDGPLEILHEAGIELDESWMGGLDERRAA